MAYTSGTTSMDLVATAKSLHMVNFTDTAPNPGDNAWLILRDGGASGTQVLNIRVQPATSETVVFPPDRPLPFPNGLYVQAAGGSLRWTVDAT